MSDLSIFKKFNFDRPPVGIKFLLNKPSGIKKLDKTLAFCEMLPEAHQGSPFYATKEDFECVGPLILGMEEPDPIFESGQMGPKLGLFKEARANQRIYPPVPRLAQGTARYIVFSPMDKMTFEPDVLVFTADPTQAEILLRAYSYTTGKMWTAKGTTVIGCAWLFIYPYLSGELNFTVTNFSSGWNSRQVLPKGLVIISIPYDQLPMMVENLKEMEWVPSDYLEGRDAHNRRFQEVAEELKQEFLASK
ncbi:MAG: DUF169 domain-containing protein [Dehalococcoidales bacterium]|nr:DUF169 domain-containing protein [Dehalococcoidales bacterium]